VNLTPLDVLDIGLSMRWSLNDWDKKVDDPLNAIISGNGQSIGANSTEKISATIDVGYYPVPAVKTYAFYTYEDSQHDWRGWDTVGFNPIGSANDAENRWDSRDTDTFHTVGAGVNWQAIEEKLKLGADFLWTRSDDQDSIVVGSASPVPGSPGFPLDLAEVYNVSLHADWEFQEGLTLRVGYLWSQLHSSDWQLDGVDADTLNNVIASGRAAPNYSVHIPSLSVVYQFQ
jgi:opacity protein-like surface antigen